MRCYTGRVNLFRRKEVRVPTAQGWLLLTAGFCLLAALFVAGLYPFLAVQRPHPSAGLVLIEGWLCDRQLGQVVSGRRPGQKFVATGCDFEIGTQLLPYKTYADITEARLLAAGMLPDEIVTTPALGVTRDRTYASAKAARAALEKAGLFGVPVTIYTSGAHSRRTLLLYRHAFGAAYPLGIVALDPVEFPPARWWRYSEGVKHVLMEAIAWVYARLTVFSYD